MAEVTLNPLFDCEINNSSTSSSDANYDHENNFVIGELNSSTGTFRLCIKFDLSGLTISEQVTDATLRMYAYEDFSSNARNFHVYRLKKAFVSTDVNWEIYSSGNLWTTPGGFDAADCEQTAIGTLNLSNSEANGYKEWALNTVAIQAIVDGTWTNNGFLVKAETESDDAYRFYSNDNADNKPQLVITYEPRGGFRHRVIVM